MSREILFRGKRINNGKWEYGYFLQYALIYEEQTYILPLGSVCNSDVEVEPETVCQYTGLKDKNGREIFEGDILSAHLDDQYPEDITYVQVTWDGFSWCARESTEDDVMSESDCNTFGVCGNIFDNPELIN